jgi:hypothetical protein
MPKLPNARTAVICYPIQFMYSQHSNSFISSLPKSKIYTLQWLHKPIHSFIHTLQYICIVFAILITSSIKNSSPSNLYMLTVCPTQPKKLFWVSSSTDCLAVQEHMVNCHCRIIIITFTHTGVTVVSIRYPCVSNVWPALSLFSTTSDLGVRAPSVFHVPIVVLISQFFVPIYT